MEDSIQICIPEFLRNIAIAGLTFSIMFYLMIVKNSYILNLMSTPNHVLISMAFSAAMLPFDVIAFKLAININTRWYFPKLVFASEQEHPHK